MRVGMSLGAAILSLFSDGDVIKSPIPPSPKQKAFRKPVAAGAGARRAAERLARHRAKWDNVPSAERVTRQQIRRQTKPWKRRYG